MINIILINCLSISFQIHAVTSLCQSSIMLINCLSISIQIHVVTANCYSKLLLGELPPTPPPPPLHHGARRHQIWKRKQYWRLPQERRRKETLVRWKERRKMWRLDRIVIGHVVKKTWPNQEKVGGALKAQVPAKAIAPNQIMALLMAQTGERYVKRLASDILQRGPYILKDFSWK
jgi:hypothetical protein